MKRNCKYYPCHFKGQDCSFCYCPLYPCEQEEFGGKWKEKVWDCSNCTIIHDENVAYQLKTYIRYLIGVYKNNE